jgi:hypothetical protein
MMKQLIIFLVASVVALVLHNPANANIFGGTTNNFRTFSQAHANAAAFGTGYGGAGGAGGSGGGASINQRRFAAMAYAPSVGATIPCALSMNAAGSGLSFGFSAGFTYKDKECNIREGLRTIASLAAIGVIPVDVAESMSMDGLCTLVAVETSRECVKHLAMRETEDNASGVPPQASEVPPVRRAKFEDLMPWNWGKN